MAFCMNCGTRLPDEAARCAECGASVGGQESSTDDPGLTAETKQHARADRKIAAIKAYRDATRSSLKDAKDAVETGCAPRASRARRVAGVPSSVLVLLLCLAGFVCWR